MSFITQFTSNMYNYHFFDDKYLILCKLIQERKKKDKMRICTSSYAEGIILEKRLIFSNFRFFLIHYSFKSV